MMQIPSDGEEEAQNCKILFTNLHDVYKVCVDGSEKLFCTRRSLHPLDSTEEISIYS
jgi:hypothetical protein